MVCPRPSTGARRRSRAGDPAVASCRSVLVTGGQGFTGRHLVAGWLAADRDVRIVAIGRSPRLDETFTHTVTWDGRTVRAPIPAGRADRPRGPLLVREPRPRGPRGSSTVCSAKEVDTVVHLAASCATRPSPSWSAPTSRAPSRCSSRRWPPGARARVVLGSSGSVYGAVPEQDLPMARRQRRRPSTSTRRPSARVRTSPRSPGGPTVSTWSSPGSSTSSDRARTSATWLPASPASSPSSWPGSGAAPCRSARSTPRRLRRRARRAATRSSPSPGAPIRWTTSSTSRPGVETGTSRCSTPWPQLAGQPEPAPDPARPAARLRPPVRRHHPPAGPRVRAGAPGGRLARGDVALLPRRRRTPRRRRADRGGAVSPTVATDGGGVRLGTPTTIDLDLGAPEPRRGTAPAHGPARWIPTVVADPTTPSATARRRSGRLGPLVASRSPEQLSLGIASLVLAAVLGPGRLAPRLGAAHRQRAQRLDLRPGPGLHHHEPPRRPAPRCRQPPPRPGHQRRHVRDLDRGRCRRASSAWWSPCAGPSGSPRPRPTSASPRP